MHDVSNPRDTQLRGLQEAARQLICAHRGSACMCVCARVRACVSLSAGVCAEIRKSIRVHEFFKSTLPTVAAWRRNNSQRVLMRGD